MYPVGYMNIWQLAVINENHFSRKMSGHVRPLMCKNDGNWFHDTGIGKRERERERERERIHL